MFVGSRTYRPSLWARLFLSKNWKLKLDLKRRDHIQITGGADLDCMEINSVATTSGILWSTVKISANGRVETLTGLSGDSAKQLQADIIGFINLHLGDLVEQGKEQLRDVGSAIGAIVEFNCVMPGSWTPSAATSGRLAP